VGDHAGLPGEAWILLGVGGQDGLAAVHHLAGHRAADAEVAALQRLLVDVAGHAGNQVAVVIEEHQEAALGPGQLDDGVHHLVEHDLHVERGTDQAGDLVQGGQPLLLGGVQPLGDDLLQHQAEHFQAAGQVIGIDAPGPRLAEQQGDGLAGAGDRHVKLAAGAVGGGWGGRLGHWAGVRAARGSRAW